MDDPHDLARFVDAQNGVYERVLAELRAGRKGSHWMWFVFPQLRGLGSSPMAQRYGIESVAEALAYWQHPVLGRRLAECTDLMLAVDNRTAAEILGSVDALKFCSSMTLFSAAVPDEQLFRRALEKYCPGGDDGLTLAMVGGS